MSEKTAVAPTSVTKSSDKKHKSKDAAVLEASVTARQDRLSENISELVDRVSPARIIKRTKKRFNDYVKAVRKGEKGIVNVGTIALAGAVVALGVGGTLLVRSQLQHHDVSEEITIVES